MTVPEHDIIQVVEEFETVDTSPNDDVRMEVEIPRSSKKVCSIVCSAAEEIAVTDEIIAATSACWSMEIDVLGQPVDFLVDTGSSVTILSQKIWDNGKRSALDKSDKRLWSANGTEIQVQGQVWLDFKVDDMEFEHRTTIADLGRIPAILGTDFMKRNRFIVDVHKGIVWIQGTEVVLKRYPKILNRVVEAVEAVVIESGQGVVMRSQVAQGAEVTNQTCLFQPSNEIENIGVVVAEGLMEEKDGTVTICLCNDSREDIEIPAGAVLGNLEVVKIEPESDTGITVSREDAVAEEHMGESPDTVAAAEDSQEPREGRLSSGKDPPGREPSEGRLSSGKDPPGRKPSEGRPSSGKDPPCQEPWPATESQSRTVQRLGKDELDPGGSTDNRQVQGPCRPSQEMSRRSPARPFRGG